MKKLKVYFSIISVLVLFACSEDNESHSGDHVWKDQTDTMDKAMEVEGMLKDSTDEKKKAINALTE